MAIRTKNNGITAAIRFINGTSAATVSSAKSPRYRKQYIIFIYVCADFEVCFVIAACAALPSRKKFSAPRTIP